MIGTPRMAVGKLESSKGVLRARVSRSLNGKERQDAFRPFDSGSGHNLKDSQTLVGDLGLTPQLASGYLITSAVAAAAQVPRPLAA